MSLLAGVRHTIARHHLASPDTRVVAAVSGGSDSVALLHVLLELAMDGALNLVGVAHFNHQLRESADADERFCADVAAGLGLPFVVDRADVAALARRQRRSLEYAGRSARYEFFARIAPRLAADAVALGHTRDDQAETLLLRLMRGAGARGLASMHPRNGLVIRPLIACRREELRSYLRERHIEWRHDVSNDDVRIPRNRVRAELVPLLKNRFNPSVVDVLADQASIQQAQHAYVSAAAADWLVQCSTIADGVAMLDAAALVQAPLAVARVAMWQAMTAVSAGAIGFDDVERALALALPRSETAFDGPGMLVERIGPNVVLTGRPPGHAGRWMPRRGHATSFEYSLSIPGEVIVPEARFALSAEIASDWSGPTENRSVVAVQMGQMDRFVVRNRRPGDRFQPLGLDGRKKLHDFFIDRKVPRTVRDEVPLVVDAADRIVWVAGHAIDEAFRVKYPAQRVIILRLKVVGGSV